MTTLKTVLPELYSRQVKDYFLATTPATTPGIYRASPSVDTCTLRFVYCQG